MAKVNGYVNRKPTQKSNIPQYLKINATNKQTKISRKYSFKALKFNPTDSKMLLFIKNINGAENMVTKTQIAGKISVGNNSEKAMNQKR